MGSRATGTFTSSAQRQGHGRERLAHGQRPGPDREEALLVRSGLAHPEADRQRCRQAGRLNLEFLGQGIRKGKARGLGMNVYQQQLHALAQITQVAAQEAGAPPRVVP